MAPKWWKSKILAIKPRIYPLSIDAKQLVDKTFNKMYNFDYLKFLSSYMSFRFPVFVVWKTIANVETKSQAVVDIHKPNNLIIHNAYSLPLQSEIIANVYGYTNLAMFNTTFFFYRSLLHPDYYYIFIVIIYWGYKIFQIPIMASINLVAYV